MNLIADSKDYSPDRRALGFTLLLCFSIPLMFAPLYLLVAPSAFGVPFPAAFAMLAGGLALMVFLGAFLKGRGMLFKVPLRVFEEGIMIQPAMGMRPIVVPYADISAVEFWHGAEGKIKSGCQIQSPQRGKIKSVENFADKNSTKSFAERIRPVLERNGFRQDVSQEGEASARYSFRRPLAMPNMPARGFQ